MFTIDETIQELDELEKIIKNVSFTKNRSNSLLNKLSRNKQKVAISKKTMNNKKSTNNIFHNFSSLYKAGYNNKSININKSTSTDSIKENFKFNLKNFKPGNLLFEIFIHISEFDENKFDFYVSYSNLCCLLKEVNLVNRIIYSNVIITQNDLDIILKKVKKNNNSSKKLNFKDFFKFFFYLVYKMDYMHFIEEPKRTLNFNINKFFGNYFNKNKMNFIGLIYNYILYVQQETNINELLNPIIPYIKNIFIKFFKINEENKNIPNESDDDSENMIILKYKFKSVINVMKYMGIFPVLINIKELVVVFYTQLDDNNDNEYLNVDELNSGFYISFKKFCQLFFCLSLFIKDKKHEILDQYIYLLKEDNENDDFYNELKLGLKKGIIRFILNLRNKNLDKNNIRVNKRNMISKEKFYNELKNMNEKDMDFVFKIFEYYSSHYDKYLNYQISFNDIIVFLKDCELLLNNKNKTNFGHILEEKYYLAKNRINNNISKLKETLYSSSETFNMKNSYTNYKSSNLNNYEKINKICLRDVEIFYCKVSKRADINKRLNFREFLELFYLISDKLGFKSIIGLIEFLCYRKKTNMKIFKQKNNELRKINILYYEIQSNEVFEIIQQISPIINIYFISFANKINKYNVTFDIFIKIFIEFDLYPNVVGNSILRNIFYELYQINKIKLKFDEKINFDIFEEKKEIGFDKIFIAIGLIALHLKSNFNLDEKQILFGIFYKIAESKKIKLDLNLNFNFSDNLKNKLCEISKLYFTNSDSEQSEFKFFL